MAERDEKDLLPEDREQLIRQLAYFLWEAGGRQHGRALEHWLTAEQEVLSVREVFFSTDDAAPDESGAHESDESKPEAARPSERSSPGG